MRSAVAALQMVSTADIDENLAVAARLIEQAAVAGAALAVLPETFAQFSSMKQLSLGREEAFGAARVQDFLAEQALRHKIFLVGGTLPFASPDSESKVYSASLVYNDSGEQIARYNKIHLFDVDVGDAQGRYRESDTFLAGDSVVVVDTPLGRLGLSICYDLRFPELYRQLFQKNVDLVAVPSAFTLKTGEAHWLPLLRARAIENQCYMIAANQGGEHSANRRTSGASAIIDGWGRVLAKAALGEACILADFDRQALADIRRAMPIAEHCRLL